MTRPIPNPKIGPQSPLGEVGSWTASDIAEELYQRGRHTQLGISINKNPRDTFLMFKEAAKLGHTKAKEELAKCYRDGIGCERNRVKAARLGDSKMALEYAKELEKQGSDECVRYYWRASDLGDSEGTKKLIEIYQTGSFVKKNIDEAKRLMKLVATQPQTTEDGLQWQICPNRILLIKGSAPMNDYNTHRPPWYDYKDMIQEVQIKGGVKSIGRCAFTGLNELERIEIGPYVDSIQSNPFTVCPKLSCISVNSNNNSFLSEEGILFSKDKTRLISCPMTKRGDYIVPDGVKEVGDAAFSGCSQLQNVTLPYSVVLIGMSAFEGCSNFFFSKDRYGSGQKKQIHLRSWGFSGCEKLTGIDIFMIGSMETDAFEGAKISFPSKYKDTRDRDTLFDLCKRFLNGDGLPMNINRAYQLCTKVIESTTGDLIYEVAKELYNEALNDGTRRAISVYLSDKAIKEAGEIAWHRDSTIRWGYDGANKRLIIRGIGQIDEHMNALNMCVMMDYATGDTPWSEQYNDQIESAVVCYGISSLGTNLFSNCRKLRSVILPEGLTSIGNQAFAGCDQLSKIYIPSSVANIDYNPFSSCRGLKSIELSESNQFFELVCGILFDKERTKIVLCTPTIVGNYTVPDTVTCICRSAFSNCTELTSITIPNSVKTIEVNAFTGCTQLRSVSLPRGIEYLTSGIPISTQITFKES